MATLTAQEHSDLDAAFGFGVYSQTRSTPANEDPRRSYQDAVTAAETSLVLDEGIPRRWAISFSSFAWSNLTTGAENTAARATALRPLATAQLEAEAVDEDQWAYEVAVALVNEVLAQACTTAGETTLASFCASATDRAVTPALSVVEKWGAPVRTYPTAAGSSSTNELMAIPLLVAAEKLETNTALAKAGFSCFQAVRAVFARQARAPYYQVGTQGYGPEWHSALAAVRCWQVDEDADVLTAAIDAAIGAY